MGYGAMTRDFLELLREGREPLSNFGRAARDLRIVFAAYAQMDRHDEEHDR